MSYWPIAIAVPLCHRHGVMTLGRALWRSGQSAGAAAQVCTSVHGGLNMGDMRISVALACMIEAERQAHLCP